MRLGKVAECSATGCRQRTGNQPRDAFQTEGRWYVYSNDGASEEGDRRGASRSEDGRSQPVRKDEGRHHKDLSFGTRFFIRSLVMEGVAQKFHGQCFRFRNDG